jgi:hypothetical protein
MMVCVDLGDGVDSAVCTGVGIDPGVVVATGDVLVLCWLQPAELRIRSNIITGVVRNSATFLMRTLPPPNFDLRRIKSATELYYTVQALYQTTPDG